MTQDATIESEWGKSARFHASSPTGDWPAPQPYELREQRRWKAQHPTWAPIVNGATRTEQDALALASLGDHRVLLWSFDSDHWHGHGPDSHRMGQQWARTPGADTVIATIEPVLTALTHSPELS